MFYSRKVLVALGCACMLTQSHASQQVEYYNLLNGLKGECSETKSKGNLKELVDGLEWNAYQKEKFMDEAWRILLGRHNRRQRTCNCVKTKVQKRSLPQSSPLKRTTSAQGPKKSREPALKRSASVPSPSSRKPTLEEGFRNAETSIADLFAQLDDYPFLDSYVVSVNIALNKLKKSMRHHDVNNDDSAVRQKLAAALKDLVDHSARDHVTATVTKSWGRYITHSRLGESHRYSILKGATVIVLPKSVYDNDRIAVQTTNRYTYPVAEFKKYFKRVETKMVYPESIRRTIREMTRLLKSIISMPEVVVKN